MEAIHAEEVLEQIPLVCFPDMKKEARTSIEKKYTRMASANRETNIKTLTPEELAYGVARKQIDGQ